MLVLLGLYVEAEREPLFFFFLIIISMNMPSNLLFVCPINILDEIMSPIYERIPQPFPELAILQCSEKPLMKNERLGRNQRF